MRGRRAQKQGKSCGKDGSGHGKLNTWGGRSERRAYTRGVDTFTLVSTVLVGALIVTVVLLGVFSKRSALDILDWKPTRSPQVEAENEVDDIEQMVAAQNELRRRRGKPERTLEEIEDEWRAS